MNTSRIREPAAVGVVPTLPGPAPGGWAATGGAGTRPVATAHLSQPCLTWGFPPWQPPPGNGLVAVVSAAEATRGWVESLLAIDGSRQVVWGGLGGRPERKALDLVERFTVPAATLVQGRNDARQAWVAVRVAQWLSHRRSSSGGRVRSCLTSWAPPTPPTTNTVRIPHLVSIWHGTTARDAVVWELTELAAAQLQMRLPADWEFFDRHVTALLDLRAMLRTGQFPATPLARRVLELVWACGDELSIELVYRNADLFRTIVETWRGLPSRAGGGHR